MAGLRYIAVFSSQPDEAFKLACSFSPQVSRHDSGAVILTVPKRYEEEVLEGLLQGSVASGSINFASAATQTAAILTARIRPGVRVPEDETESFLSRFPVQVLSVYSQRDLAVYLATLERWGIRTLKQLASLPRQELSARLGPDAWWLQELARGKDVDPFQPHPPEDRFQATKELDWELDGLEPLAFALGDILEHLCRRLSKRGLSTDQLNLVFRLADGTSHRRTIPLACPMRQSKTLLSLLLLKLQSDPPQSPVKRVFIEANPAPPQVLQTSLLEPTGPKTEDLSRTLARLTALMGEKSLGTPRVEDSHRPDSVSLRDFPLVKTKRKDTPSDRRQAETGGKRLHLVLRRIRPPRSTRLCTDQIVACAGPWKSSGDWWQPPLQKSESIPAASQPWWRDEWDVQLKQGGVYRVFWDHRRKEWFMDGVYD